MPLRFLKKIGRTLLGRGGKRAVVRTEPKRHSGGSDASPRQQQRPPRHDGRPSRPARGRGEEPRRQQQPHRQAAQAAREPAPAAPSAPWSVDMFPVPPEPGKVRFHDLDLPEEVMHAIADLDFKYCTPIQAKALPAAFAGGNVAARAQTGTGKTAAFLVFMLTHFIRTPPPERRPNGTPRALILAPTRELVLQIVKDAVALSKHSNVRSMAVYGGMDYNKQKQELLSRPIDILAATPGRLLDFMGSGDVDVGKIEFLIIDEADRMLDMGFIPDVKRIIRRTPPREQRRSMLFSATLTTDVIRLASMWMPDPVVIEVEPEKVTVDTVRQVVYTVSSRDKFKVLWNILQQPDVTRVLIFGNRRDRTERLADELARHGLECGLLSGAVDQKKRLTVLEKFRSGAVRVLVATDVAARGLHVDDVSHVVNYDLPYEPDDYVHRIGRTGRAGESGEAISLACEDGAFILPEIEKYIGRSLPCEQPPESLFAPLPAATRPATHFARHSASAPRRYESGGGRSFRSGPRRGPGRR